MVDHNKNQRDIKKLEQLILERDLSTAEINALIDQIRNPNLKPKTYQHLWGTKHIKIGLMGDVHIGSIYEDHGVLKDLFNRYKKEGVDAVYVTGDLTEGYNMRPGHSFECYLHGADKQIEGVIEKFPHIGKPIYFITGDHDYSHFKRQGIDVGRHISEKREDMVYLGMFYATINISEKTNLMLMHPTKGTAYALSYHPQKIAEAFSGGEKPNILALGHFHKIEYLFYRNVHVLQTGCTQNQTAWMKRMNLAAHKGGWLADVYMKKDGTIDKLELKLFPYYR